MTHPRERLGPVRLAMLAAVLAGEPVEAVAARGGVTRKTLLGVVALARRQAGTGAPAALAAWARRRAAEIGQRPARVEAAVRAAVAAWAPRYGVPPHQVYGPGRTRALSAVRAHAIRAGAAAGGTAAQIGRVLGLAESSVYYVLAGGKTARAAA